MASKTETLLSGILKELKTLNKRAEERTELLRRRIDAGTPKEAKVMFEALRKKQLPDSTRAFIDSLEQGMNVYSQLTSRQYDCLRQNYNKFVHGIPF